jgi:hypothetical protein
VTVDTLGRAFDLYRRTATSRSALALLIANAIPLVGVLFFGLEPADDPRPVLDRERNRRVLERAPDPAGASIDRGVAAGQM